MATVTFTSSPFQHIAFLPERGAATGVTVAGFPWSFAQSGPDDPSLEFAPALPGGQAVVITYTPMPVVVADVSALAAALPLKADTAALNALAARVAAVESAGPGQGTGGGTAAIRVAASNAIPLDNAVAGKAMPLTPGLQISIDTPTVITVAPGAVDGGVCVADYKLNAALDLSGCIAKGDPATVGNNARVSYEYSAVEGKPFAFVSLGSALQQYAPGAPTLALGSGTASTQSFVLTAPAVDSAHSAAVTYAILKSVDGGTTWLPGYSGTSLTPTITGVTQTTKFKANATNATGTGPDSNVLTVVGSSLSISDLGTGGSDVDLTALAGSTGWTTFSDNTTDSWFNAAGQANIGSPQYVNAVRKTGGTGVNATVSFSDNVARGLSANAGSGANLCTGFGPVNNASEGSAYWTIPVSAQGLKVRIRVFSYWSNNGYGVRASLSDGSAPTVTQMLPQYSWKDFEVAYGAKAAGQTLKLEVFFTPGSDPNGIAVEFIAIHP